MKKLSDEKRFGELVKLLETSIERHEAYIDSSIHTIEIQQRFNEQLKEALKVLRP